MLERRRHDRMRAFAAGVIRCGRRGDATDCVVRDLSEGGALLLVDEPQRAPLHLVLASHADAKPARVVWRGRIGVGVAFEPAPKVVGDTRASFAATFREDRTARSEALVPAALPTSGRVVSLDAARRARAGDGGRLAERVARFVRRPGTPDPA